MEYLHQLGFALLLGVPVACIVWTFTQEEIFKECREALKAYQQRHADSLLRRKLAYLPTCPYCFSHYVALAFVALLNFRMLADDWRGYVVSLFTLVLIANAYVTLYNLLRVALRAAKVAADRLEREAGWELGDGRFLEGEYQADVGEDVVTRQFRVMTPGSRRRA